MGRTVRNFRTIDARSLWGVARAPPRPLAVSFQYRIRVESRGGGMSAELSYVQLKAANEARVSVSKDFKITRTEIWRALNTSTHTYHTSRVHINPSPPPLSTHTHTQHPPPPPPHTHTHSPYAAGGASCGAEEEKIFLFSFSTISEIRGVCGVQSLLQFQFTHT